MSHNIEWDNEDKTVILQSYESGATKDDLYLLAKTSAEMMATVEHDVHLIIDERNIRLVLNSADMNYLERNVPSNQGRVVVIPPKGSAAYKKMVQEIAHRTAPKAFNEPTFVNSVEEARDILQEVVEVRYP